MGDHDTEPEPPTPELAFAEFLKDTYHLFVIVSVFGVIGVYLSAVRERGIYGGGAVPLLDIAIVASLLLVVVVSMYIDFTFVFAFTDELMNPTALFSRKSVLFAVFLVPFNVLIFSLVVVLARFDQLVYFVVGLSSFIGGVLVFGTVSRRIFTVFERRAESEGYSALGGLVAFGVYNVLLFAGALFVVSAVIRRLGGIDGLFVSFSNGDVAAALLYSVVGIAVMPVVMLLGFLLYVYYYKLR